MPVFATRRAGCYGDSVAGEMEDFEVRLREALLPIEAIRVAYLFGSRARGGARRDSDLDIGVGYPRDLDARGREQARRAIVGALTDSIGALGERADVVDLEAADSAVAFNAIRQGRLVFARSAAERIRLVTLIARRYDDDRPKRALFRKAALEAVARMGAS